MSKFSDAVGEHAASSSGCAKPDSQEPRAIQLRPAKFQILVVLRKFEQSSKFPIPTTLGFLQIGTVG
jgi:hypothetical protein